MKLFLNLFLFLSVINLSAQPDIQTIKIRKEHSGIFLITIVNSARKPISNTKMEVRLDDTLAYISSTDSLGQIDNLLTTVGRHSITVTTEGYVSRTMWDIVIGEAKCYLTFGLKTSAEFKKSEKKAIHIRRTGK